MSYIPPHKRHTKDNNSPCKPERLISPSENNNHRSFGYKNISKDSGRIYRHAQAQGAVSTWFSVGLDDDDGQFTRLVRFEPISLKSYEEQKRSNELPQILVLDDSWLLQPKGDYKISPVKRIVTLLEKDLIHSFGNVRMLMEECPELKPTLVARFGRNLFYGTSSISSTTSITEAILKPVHKTFYTNLPPSYLKFVEDEAVDKIGLKLSTGKEIYQVKVLDRLHPDSEISCKCRIVKNLNKLEVYKMELKQLRHFVADISCIGQKTDVRLMLYTKRVVSSLIVEEEKKKIENMINSAVIDPEIKGGVRWPLGKQSDGDRYSIVGVWHDKSKTFRNSSMRVKIRQADRFDFGTSVGDCSGEVVLKMTELLSCFKDDKFGENVVAELLNDYMKVIWDNLVSSS
ncbi:uncharacterized protein LOC124921527 [Impatiens glandulifera]|uniref:uncharacterized protein LOC124921527 n=1 Tax=Impatiens glandulifera TaxID=253017 RepID=UPI001FB04F75|nr:uncharacterized protein LOC124921527 [Impatiens glandulifera]